MTNSLAFLKKIFNNNTTPDCHGSKNNCVISDALVKHAITGSQGISDVAKRTLEELKKLEHMGMGH